jgi:hypothetical protein
MRIKLFFLFLFFLLSKRNDGFCQVAYLLSAPSDWTIERFGLPPVFAPGLPIKGIEDIRFSPDWSKKKTEGYWTYCYLWTLQSGTPLAQTELETCLKFYYTGLVRSNLKDAKMDTVNTTPVTVKLHPIPNVATGRKAFAGELHMLDYMTQNPITLNFKIHQRGNFIFFEASPLPYTNKMWAIMDSALKEVKL